MLGAIKIECKSIASLPTVSPSFEGYFLLLKFLSFYECDFLHTTGVERCIATLQAKASLIDTDLMHTAGRANQLGKLTKRLIIMKKYQY